MPGFAANISLLFSELDFPDRFRASANCGFKAVECQFPYDWPAGEIKARLDQYGLEQVLINAPAGNRGAGELGIAALPGRAKEFQETIRLAADYADVLECCLVHVMAGIAPQGTDLRASRDTYLENLRFAVDFLAPRGIQPLIEPLNDTDVPGYYLTRLADARAVIGEVDGVGLQFDCYHVQIMEGGVEALFLDYQDIISHIQVAGVPGRHEPDGGEIDFNAVFAMLDRSGYNGWVGCEYIPRAQTRDGLKWAQKWGIVL